MERRDKVNYYLDLAEMVSQRSTCLRKHYGSVIVNNDEVISTGYVGSPRGRKNCTDIGECVRKKMGVPRGERYELCRSVHAEANAIISASRDKMIGSSMYLTGIEVDTGNYIPLNSGNTIKKASFRGTLEGGLLTWENYVLRVSLGSGQTADSYQPARVLLMAYPVEPVFLEDTKKIAGIIRAEYNITEMEITDQKFTIEDELKEDSWQERVKKESALVYQLKTTGNYFAQETDNMLQKIRIKWNPSMFSLNKNDRYLNHAEGTRLVEYDEAGGTMVIETAPYSSIKFVFFKKEDFDTEIQNMTLDEFKNTIQAEKVE